MGSGSTAGAGEAAPPADNPNPVAGGRTDTSRIPGAWQGRPPGLPRGVPPPSVPLSFLGAASLGLVACGIAWIWAARPAAGDPTSDIVVAAAHFGMLATLSMGVLGALHQFTPVVTQQPLRSVGLARATFSTWLAASWLLPIGFASEEERIVEAGGALAAVAVTLLVVNLSKPLAARGKGAPVVGLRFALGGFVVTACFGVVYVVDRTGNWFDLSGHVVMAHAVVGLFAWLGLTYVAVAEKLWPMFFLAHVPGARRAGRIAVWAVPCGVALLAPAILTGSLGLAIGGVVVLAAGVGAHLTSLGAHVIHRRRRADLHLCFVVTSALFLLVGAGLGLAGALVLPHRHSTGMALTAAAVAAFGGWLLETLVGHAHKVVPFIGWSALRARGIATNRAGKPLMFADLYGHTWAALSFGLLTAGAASLCTGVAARLPAATATGGMLFAATGVVVAANLAATPLHMLRSRDHAIASTAGASQLSPPEVVFRPKARLRPRARPRV